MKKREERRRNLICIIPKVCWRLASGGQKLLCGASDTDLTTLRIPPSITTISEGICCDASSLFSVELPENIHSIGSAAFCGCKSLRNISIPANAEIGVEGVFDQCKELLRLLLIGRNEVYQDESHIIYKMKHRFNTLPIHKMIYYQSYQPVTSDRLREVIQMKSIQGRKLRRMLGSPKVDPTGNQQDCAVGMTPLHILACSTIQNIELYEVLIDHYPEGIITKDYCGALPLLYAVWGNAPSEIMQFLVEKYQSIYPNYELNWDKMVETLAKSNAPKEVIQNLLDLHKDYFPDQHIDWETLLHVNPILSSASEETYRFLVRCSITKYINKIGLKQLRQNIGCCIETIRPTRSRDDSFDRLTYRSTIQTKLADYEAEYQKLKGTAAMLELALWKAKLDESKLVNCMGTGRRGKKKLKVDESARRSQCRVNCGAAIVIENVLPYLVPKVSPPDEVSSDSSSDDGSVSDSGSESN